MRVSVLILVLLFGIAGAPAVGHAEKVRTNQSTKVYARPGERAKVVLQVKSGQAMTVIDKDGRWLKVRVSGRTGYVARSTVDMPEADAIARNTRRRPFVDGRSRKRGASDEGPSDRIGADAVGDGDEGGDEGDDDEGDGDEDDEDVKPAKIAKATKVTPKPRPRDDGDDDEDPIDDDGGDEDGGDEDGDDDEDTDTRKQARVATKTPVYADPDDESEELFTATPSMVLYPGEKSGKWVEVENEEGDLGYVLSSALEIEETDDGGAGGGGASQIDLRVRLGVSYLTQGLRSPGGMPAVPDNYNIGIPAATLALGGGYYRAGSGKLTYGVEGTYDYARATPGVDAAGGAISMHTLNLRGVVGLDFKKKSGMMLLGRAGIRYFSYQVGQAENLAENTAKIPSEINTSPMLGVALAMPRFTNKIGLRFSLDAMLLNLSYKQTKNLEDGASPSAKGAVAGVGFTYRWKPSMDIQATYDLTYAKASFGEKVMDSQRNHPMGGVTRTDLMHAITAGIVKAF